MTSERNENLILVVEVGGRRCALAVADIVAVHRAVAVSPLPRAPAVIEGLVDVRGDALPVVDLHRRFGLPGRAIDVADHLVVIQVGSRRLALHVGPRVELRTARMAEIDHAGEIAPHARGLTRLPDGLVMIHDVEAFLWPAEIIALDAAIAHSEQPA